MKAPGKILFSGILIKIAVLTSGFVSSPGTTGGSSNQYEGVLFLEGLTDSVTVYRDGRGVPHIYALNEHDLYMAVGYVSAQERLWQMDLIRRSAKGQLSEIFGKSFLQADIFSRCLRINEKSKLILENEDPEVIACLNAYADGVNAFINSAGKKLPVEFRLLSYKPEPWSIEDICSIIGLLGWGLDSRNLTAELLIYEIINKVGIEKASRIIPEWETVKDIVYPDFVIGDTVIARTKAFISSFNHILEHVLTISSGSNNWAVSGSRSETGLPLLSNDMHLSLNTPCLWMQMHQVVPGKINVTGVMFPGEPLIVAGHNENIAWGMTNMRVDNIDLYAEKINAENHNQYLFNGEWREITSKTEIFSIKGRKQNTVELRFTHRGPIISGLMNHDTSMKIKWLGYEFLSELRAVKDISLSMKWSGFDKSDEVRAVYLLNRATGWDDFRSGLRLFRTISQNFVYADKEGNIGLIAGGGIPVRKGNGILIRSGETDDYDWKEYIPADQLPFTFNPESGQVSSANNKTVSNDYPYFISHSYDMPYRIQRIRNMLGEKEKFTVEDFKTMINDQHSEFARLLTPYILRLNSRYDELTSSESKALAALSDWDYDMDPDLTAPTIFEFFRISFKGNLLADEIDDLYKQLSDITSENYLYRLLKNGPDEWVDNVSTVEIETLDDIIMRSFKEGVGSLIKLYGKNPEKWEWGNIHTITFVHPIGSVKILGSIYKLNSEKFRIGGSDHTVCPYYSYNPGFEVNIGASVRHIFNTADWDESYSVIPGGTSGIPGSEFYLSQVKTYLDGKFYKDSFSNEAVKASAKYILSLKPAE